MRKMRYGVVSKGPRIAEPKGRMDPKHAVSGGFGGRLSPMRAAEGSRGKSSGRMKSHSRHGRSR